MHEQSNVEQVEERLGGSECHFDYHFQHLRHLCNGFAVRRQICSACAADWLSLSSVFERLQTFVPDLLPEADGGRKHRHTHRNNNMGQPQK